MSIFFQIRVALTVMIFVVVLSLCARKSEITAVKPVDFVITVMNVSKLNFYLHKFATLKNYLFFIISF